MNIPQIVVLVYLAHGVVSCAEMWLNGPDALIESLKRQRSHPQFNMIWNLAVGVILSARVLVFVAVAAWLAK